jgi:hypothetical protein
VSDVSEEDLCQARARYGFRTAKLPESGPLPFARHEFDFCFCSSVIEHVTGPKNGLYGISDTNKFKEVAWCHQQTFAKEIDRIEVGPFFETVWRLG